MIDLKAIKEKALRATSGPWECQIPAMTGQWPTGKIKPLKIAGKLYNHPMLPIKDAEYIAAVSPDVVLKLLRIIEVHMEVLLDMQRYECTNKELLAEHILTLARQAQEQVSKILTEQNEVTK